MTVIDSHMHVWRAAEGSTPGVTTLVPPQTDVPISAALAEMAAHGVDCAVLVQPVFRGEDNNYAAGCARAEPERFAAVCVVDPRKADAPVRLEYWVGRGCRGLRLRPALADEGAVFGAPSTFGLWEAAARLGVVVSVLCRPRHLKTIGELASRFPGVKIVVDHLGHPDVAAGVDALLFRDLLALARYPNIFVKLSGFYHFSAEPFPYAACWPLVREVLDQFGPRRLLWGSDFPHCTVRGGYENSLRVIDEALAELSTQDRQSIFGGTAQSLYWSGM
jgi:predicted TIM-barrel fold metal-dependent hydrolase